MVEPEHIFTVTAKQFREGVAQAAQLVAATHRKRLVLWGFIAGVAAAAFVALPVVYFTGKANCSAIGTLAHAQEHRFVEERRSSADFLKKSRDRLGLSDSDFNKLIREGQKRQQREIDATRGVAHRDCALV